MAEGRNDQAEAQHRTEEGVGSKRRNEGESEACNSQTSGTGSLTGKIINIVQLHHYNSSLPPVTFSLILHSLQSIIIPAASAINNSFILYFFCYSPLKLFTTSFTKNTVSWCYQNYHSLTVSTSPLILLPLSSLSIPAYPLLFPLTSVYFDCCETQ